jgi:hypothetical protein
MPRRPAHGIPQFETPVNRPVIWTRPAQKRLKMALRAAEERSTGGHQFASLDIMVNYGGTRLNYVTLNHHEAG